VRFRSQTTKNIKTRPTNRLNIILKRYVELSGSKTGGAGGSTTPCGFEGTAAKADTLIQYNTRIRPIKVMRFA
jgi:hypothetical protein